MLKKRLFLTCMRLCVSVLLTESGFAEAYTHWQLPEGVFARLGKGWVTDFDFSPDGSHLAVASSSRFSSVRFWDVRTGKHTQPLKTYKSVHTSTYAMSLLVSCLAFSPDGKTLVTAGDDRSIRFWDTQTSRHTQTLTGHTDYVCRVAFSPDGKTLLCYGAASLSLWDAKTGSLKHVLEHLSKIHSVAFSPDCKTITTQAMGDTSVHFWDVRTGEHIRTLTGHTDAFPSVIFSPDSKIFATQSRDGKARLWDTQTVKHRRTVTPDGGVFFSVISMAFSPDGKILATASEDGTVLLWDVPRTLVIYEHSEK